MCGRANPGLWGFAPMLRQIGVDFAFAPLVIGVSAILYVLTLVATGSNVLGGGRGMFTLLSPDVRALRWFGASGSYPVFIEGAWWTLLSATWLHGGILHILFNMMWVRDLGPEMVNIVGPGRTVIIYTMSGVSGFFLSSFAGRYIGPLPLLGGGAGITIGASAAIFGLLGALVHYGRMSGSSFIHGQAMRYAIILFVFGIIMPGIDNYAHAGGFVGGYLTSAAFNPLTRERGDHIAIAVVCLVATLVSIVVSIVHGLPLYR
jgi:rhomboid protease GluP